MTNNNSSLLKSLAAIVAVLTLLVATGCHTTNESSKGGYISVNEEFSLTVPADIALKQGSEVLLNVMVKRGAYFKRDVQLEVKAAGITVTPSSVLVKASDKPEVQLRLAATREAALGDYRLTVTGTPAEGKAATALTIVKVVAP